MSAFIFPPETSTQTKKADPVDNQQIHKDFGWLDYRNLKGLNTMSQYHTRPNLQTIETLTKTPERG
jgi:hypothetical protein